MKNNSISNQTMIGTILLVYWVPLIMLSAYGSSGKSWTLVAAGLMLSTIGAMLLLLLMRKWEQGLTQVQEIEQKEPIAKSLPEAPVSNPVDLEKVRSLELAVEDFMRKDSDNQKELEEKSAEAARHAKEKEKYRQQADVLQQELAHAKNSLVDQVDHYRTLLGEHQHSIADLRKDLQSRQQLVTHLESKVRDLSYEIKTILQIAERPQEIVAEPVQPTPPIQIGEGQTPREREAAWQDSQVQTFEEALMLLKRTLDIAQRITGAPQFGKSPRFKDLPVENYALDFRRLFDRLQSEAESPILVYAQKEEKLLFVNDQINNLLGISPEKFQQSFQEIILQGKEEWNRALGQLSFKNDSKASLAMKTRTGQELQVNCVLGIISTGIFRNHVIGILYADKFGAKSAALSQI